jgi:hypothetical protein
MEVEVGVYCKVSLEGAEPSLDLLYSVKAAAKIVYVCEANPDDVGERVEEGHVWICNECDTQGVSRLNDGVNCRDCGSSDVSFIDGDDGTLDSHYCWYCDDARVAVEQRYVCQEGCDSDNDGAITSTPDAARDHLVEQHIKMN